MRNIKGIGIINAIVLLCTTDNFQRFDNPRKFACYCGGAPFEHTSGISIWGKRRLLHWHCMKDKKNGIIRVFCCLFLL
ncbi:transposase [Phocaeicola massiliensis]|uniref:transposase n=1 Tax=Phocaeicola massiliensis TaxID=204516 RepID=UPI00397A91C6